MSALKGINRHRTDLAYASWSVAGTFLGVIATASIAIFEDGVSLFYCGLCMGMVLLTGLGVAPGLYRHFSHRS